MTGQKNVKLAFQIDGILVGLERLLLGRNDVFCVHL